MTHAFATAGTATATVTATGSPATCAAPAAATITVVAPPPRALLSLAPANPLRAPAAPVATRHAKGVGTVVTYGDSQAATMTFTIQGRRKGRARRLALRETEPQQPPRAALQPQSVTSAASPTPTSPARTRSCSPAGWAASSLAAGSYS